MMAMAFQRRGRSISQLSAIAMGVIVVVLVAFGAYSAINFSSPPNSGGTTDIPISQPGITATTSTSTQTSSSSSQSLTAVSLHIPQVVFGVNHTEVIPNETLLLSPNTLAWETFTLNKTSPVSGIQVEVNVPAATSNSNISLAYYLNGKLVTNETYPLVGIVAPPSDSTVSFPILVNSVLKVGSNATVAILAHSAVSLELAHGTGNSFLLLNATSFPEVLPRQGDSSEPLFFAWGSYG